MASHDLAMVTHVCQRLLVMAQGRIVEQLSAQDLAARRVQAPATRALLATAQGFVRQPAAAPAQSA